MTKPLTKTERDELRKLAKKAAEGPWELTHHGVIASSDADIAEVFHHSDAEFIAAYSPDVVLRMLDRLDELEKQAQADLDDLIDWACR